jgi:hypothetical protein
MLASAVMPATATATWSSIMYIFSEDFDGSRSFDCARDARSSRGEAR